MPAALAIVLGMIATALCGMISFGYLMLRPAPGSDVGDLQTFVAAVARVELPGQVELWRGIPRFAAQDERDGATQRAQGWFEPTPIQVPAAEAAWLRAYCTQERNFRRREPDVHELCGWFHADWAVVFVQREAKVEFAFCFGCDDVKILVEGYEPLHLDLYRPAAIHTYLEPYAVK